MKRGRLHRLFEEIRSAIAFDQPKLSAKIGAGSVVVEGTFLVVPTTSAFANQGPIAQYNVRIIFDRRFPNAEPQVFELDEAFPHTADFHTNQNGSCCVNVWEVWLATEEDRSVAAYINGPLKNFFLSQHVKATTGNWPFGEWDHAYDGLRDAYANILGCSNNLGKVRYILRLLSQDWPKGHWECPCGSGKILRKCCSEKFAKLHEKIAPKAAKRMLKRLEAQARLRPGKGR